MHSPLLIPETMKFPFGTPSSSRENHHSRHASSPNKPCRSDFLAGIGAPPLLSSRESSPELSPKRALKLRASSRKALKKSSSSMLKTTDSNKKVLSKDDEDAEQRTPSYRSKTLLQPRPHSSSPQKKRSLRLNKTKRWNEATAAEVELSISDFYPPCREQRHGKKAESMPSVEKGNEPLRKGLQRSLSGRSKSPNRQRKTTASHSRLNWSLSSLSFGGGSSQPAGDKKQTREQPAAAAAGGIVSAPCSPARPDIKAKKRLGSSKSPIRQKSYGNNNKSKAHQSVSAPVSPARNSSKQMIMKLDFSYPKDPNAMAGESRGLSAVRAPAAQPSMRQKMSESDPQLNSVFNPLAAVPMSPGAATTTATNNQQSQRRIFNPLHDPASPSCRTKQGLMRTSEISLSKYPAPSTVPVAGSCTNSSSATTNSTVASHRASYSPYKDPSIRKSIQHQPPPPASPGALARSMSLRHQFSQPNVYSKDGKKLSPKAWKQAYSPYKDPSLRNLEQPLQPDQHDSLSGSMSNLHHHQHSMSQQGSFSVPTSPVRASARQQLTAFSSPVASKHPLMGTFQPSSAPTSPVTKFYASATAADVNAMSQSLSKLNNPNLPQLPTPSVPVSPGQHQKNKYVSLLRRDGGDPSTCVPSSLAQPPKARSLRRECSESNLHHVRATTSSKPSSRPPLAPPSPGAARMFVPIGQHKSMPLGGGPPAQQQAPASPNPNRPASHPSLLSATGKELSSTRDLLSTYSTIMEEFEESMASIDDSALPNMPLSPRRKAANTLRPSSPIRTKRAPSLQKLLESPRKGGLERDASTASLYSSTCSSAGLGAGRHEPAATKGILDEYTKIMQDFEAGGVAAPMDQGG